MDTLQAAYLVCGLSIWPFGCSGTSRDLNENLTEKSERPPHCIDRLSFPRVALA